MIHFLLNHTFHKLSSVFMTQAALLWNLTIAASDVTSVLLQYFQNSLLTPAFSESCLPFTLVGKCLVLFRIRPKRFDTKWSANITPPDTFYFGIKGTFGKRHLETVTQTMKVDTNDVTCVIKKKALKWLTMLLFSFSLKPFKDILWSFLLEEVTFIRTEMSQD